MKIGIIGFGSIINELTRNEVTLQVQDNFQVMDKDEVSLPIRMSRESSKGTNDRRLTSVVDPNASPECVAIAQSSFRTLRSAIDNLAAREGAPNSKNIAYIVKPNFDIDQKPDNVSLANRTFHGKFSGAERKYKLKEAQALILANWLNNSEYEALIWTALPPNITTGVGTPGSRGREILPMLTNDPTLLKNTKDYILKLPYQFWTSLHFQILALP